jgi:hypothetical protein
MNEIPASFDAIQYTSLHILYTCPVCFERNLTFKVLWEQSCDDENSMLVCSHCGCKARPFQHIFEWQANGKRFRYNPAGDVDVYPTYRDGFDEYLYIVQNFTDYPSTCDDIWDKDTGEALMDDEFVDGFACGWGRAVSEIKRRIADAIKKGTENVQHGN